MNFSINSRTNAGFVAALVFLVGVGFISYFATERSLENARWVRHTHQVLGDLGRVRAGVEELESARRGYALTGDSEFLTSFNETQKFTEQAVARVEYLTEDQLVQQRRVTELGSR